MIVQWEILFTSCRLSVAGLPSAHSSPRHRVYRIPEFLACRRRRNGRAHPVPRLVALAARPDRHLAAEPANESRHLPLLALPDGDLVGPGHRAVLQRWVPAIPRHE